MEDNAADVGLVREALKEHGVEGELLVLTDGDQAVQFIQDIDAHTVACPDLFIVDLNLPKRPGIEVLERMRLSHGCHKARVVILSSSDSQTDRDDVSQLGISNYICKPSRLEEFIALGAVFKTILET